MSRDWTISVAGLVVEHRTLSGPLRALDCDDLVIPSGTSVAIVGPSGCGKSTLLGALAGLAAPSRGSITIGDTELTALPPAQRTAFRKRAIGVVYQADNLLPFLTVGENVLLRLAICGNAVRPEERVQSLLDRLGLGSLAGRLPDHLSGGQRQRVAVARAVAHRPGVILADEPTGALDRASGSAVIDVLVEASRALGATLVVVTHDPGVAARLGRVVNLRDGVVTGDTEWAGAR